MAQRTLSVSKDAMVALSGGTSLGAGAEQHLPVGLMGGYLIRSLVAFNLNFTDVVSLNFARLYLRANNAHTAIGASAGIHVDRVSTAWTEGTAGELAWSSANAVEWDNQPGADTSNRATDNTFGRTDEAWEYIDITGIVQQWIDGLPNHGVLIRSVNEGLNAAATGFYSRESAYDPYILIDYDTNAAPDAPTGLSPSGGYTVSGAAAPPLTYTHNDDDGDATTHRQIQVASDSGFSTILHDTGKVANVVADGAIGSYSGYLPPRGGPYWWRVRVWDASGAVSSYSTGASFSINSLPVVTLTDPGATGRLAHMHFEAGWAWASPRMWVDWTWSDANGHAQTHYTLEIAQDAAGSPGALIVSGDVASSATSAQPAAVYTEGAYYHVRLRAFDGFEWSAWQGWYRVRARWGHSIHKKDVSIAGLAPTAWSSAVNWSSGVTFRGVIEYNSADDAAGTNLGAVWKASLGSVTKRKFVYYRVWLFTWGTSPGTLPQLLDVTIQVTGNVIQPDHWLPSPLSSENAEIELSDRVFGTQSLKITGDGASHSITQSVSVEPNTDYVLQGRIRSIGDSKACIELRDTQTGVVPIWSTDLKRADTEWEHTTGVVWNSGERTSVWIALKITGLTGTAALFDGLKMERGRVASPWTPGLIGTAAVVDAGGISVDGRAGGTFRLLGSDGDTRDRVELGPSGLLIGGDEEFVSAAPGTLDMLGPAATDNWFRVLSKAAQSGGFLVRQDGVAGSYVMLGKLSGEASLELGDVALGTRDVRLSRSAADVLKLASGDRLDNDAVGVTVRKTSAQAIAHNTWTRVAGFTNTDRAPFGVSWSPYGGSEVRVDTPGWYMIILQGRWTAAAGGGRYLGVLKGNAATPPTVTPDLQLTESRAPIGAGSDYMHWTGMMNLALNDTIAVGAFQNKTTVGTLNLDNVTLSVIRIGV